MTKLKKKQKYDQIEKIDRKLGQNHYLSLIVIILIILLYINNNI